MKLTLNIIGSSIAEIKLGLEDFMQEVKNESLKSSNTGADNSKNVKYVFDYELTNSKNIWEVKNNDKMINPYTKTES